ncbi:MAG: CotH kinase family protein [Salinivirgaceae bacterium]|jgi:hypothetical protein|nr:CotH kinase family protein [Salinivirgaceae bacterium]
MKQVFLVIIIQFAMLIIAVGQICRGLTPLNTDSIAALENESLFQLTSSNLPIVKITASFGDLEAGMETSGHMEIINNEYERNNISDRANDYDRKISIEYLGGFNLMFPKKSFLIETQRDNGENFDAEIMGLSKENDWILYAPYSDKSLLHNTFTHELVRRAGHYGLGTKYCELVFNGQYHGIYILMETIKKDKYRVDIATINKEDTVGNELTGGYIFKIDELPENFSMWTHGWLSDNSFPDAMDLTYQYVYPKAIDIGEQQKDYLRDYISEFESILESDNFTDPNIGYNKYIDVGSFVDYMLINEIAKSVNSYGMGTYFYKKKNSKGAKLFAGPLSDYSYAYANTEDWISGKLASGFVYPGKLRVIYWWYRLMQDEYFYNLSYTRWLELRSDMFSDASFSGIIDSVVNEIDEAQQRNFEKWPILGTYVWPNSYIGESYANEVQFFKDWIDNRTAWLDNELFGTVLEASAKISNKQHVAQMPSNSAIGVSLTDEYFCAHILSKKYFTLTGLPSYVYIDTVFFESASEATIILSANATPENVTNYLTLTISDSVLNGFNSVSSNNLVLSANEYAVDTQIKMTTHKGALILRCNQPEKYAGNIELFNTLGQKVGSYPIQKKVVNKVELNLPSNVYIVRIANTNNIFTQRIVWRN